MALRVPRGSAGEDGQRERCAGEQDGRGDAQAEVHAADEGGAGRMCDQGTGGTADMPGECRGHRRRSRGWSARSGVRDRGARASFVVIMFVLVARCQQAADDRDAERPTGLQERPVGPLRRRRCALPAASPSPRAAVDGMDQPGAETEQRHAEDDPRNSSSRWGRRWRSATSRRPAGRAWPIVIVSLVPSRVHGTGLDSGATTAIAPAAGSIRTPAWRAACSRDRTAETV